MLEVFLKPYNLIFIVLIPVFISIFILIYAVKKKNILEYFSEENFLRNTGFRLKENILVRAILFSMALLFIVIALARPQWGQKSVNIRREGMDIVIAVDISKSMNSEDINPSRFRYVRNSVRKLLDNLKGDRVSLVFFGQRPFVMVPFTTDYYTVNLALDNLSPQDFPMPGTNYSNLFVEVQDMFERSKAVSRVLLLYSDGEDLEKTSESLLRLDGTDVYTVGVGTREGGYIPVYDENGIKKGVKRYRGEVVQTKLKEEMLENIARINRGKYIPVNGDYREADLIGADLAEYKKSLLKEEKKTRKIERYRPFLIVAFLFLFIETFFLNYWGGISKRF
ncbi:MAG: vWA domain-containing protein [Candidatus Muiribacteriaceae bacterium]